MKSRKARIIMLIVTIVMYLLAAGAPGVVGPISG
jgi:flagellar basal body-associated protein FliL